MNADKQRKALAEFEGWTMCRISKNPAPDKSWEMEMVRCQGLRPGEHYMECCPLYLTDLNAMARVEAQLFRKERKNSSRLRTLYRSHIQIKMKNMGYSETWWGHAGADIRAEALLRTINKWEEE